MLWFVDTSCPNGETGGKLTVSLTVPVQITNPLFELLWIRVKINPFKRLLTSFGISTFSSARLTGLYVAS